MRVRFWGTRRSEARIEHGSVWVLVRVLSRRAKYPLLQDCLPPAAVHQSLLRKL